MHIFSRYKAEAVAIAITAMVTTPASAYDLRIDWSDAANPNGPWTYRVGTTVLPHSSSWTAGVSAFTVVQPAYQPANVIGNFLPAWFKMTNSLPTFDTQAGDIVVHTNDSFNGNPALGVANVLFTAPLAGQYHIFGDLWNASTTLAPSDFRPRPQDWQILVNGVVPDYGVLDAIPGHFTRSSPEIFDLGSVLLNVGDTVELDVFRDPAAQAGFFVGTNLTLDLVDPTTPSTVPEPASWSLLAAGIIGFGIARRRSRPRV